MGVAGRVHAAAGEGAFSAPNRAPAGKCGYVCGVFMCLHSGYACAVFTCVRGLDGSGSSLSSMHAILLTQKASHTVAILALYRSRLREASRSCPVVKRN